MGFHWIIFMSFKIHKISWYITWLWTRHPYLGRHNVKVISWQCSVYSYYVAWQQQYGVTHARNCSGVVGAFAALDSELLNIVKKKNIFPFFKEKIIIQILKYLFLFPFRYEKSNRNYLLQNVAFALFGSPSCEGELTEVIGDQHAHLEGYNSRQKEQVMKVYEKLCEQSMWHLS